MQNRMEPMNTLWNGYFCGIKTVEDILAGDDLCCSGLPRQRLRNLSHFRPDTNINCETVRK